LVRPQYGQISNRVSRSARIEPATDDFGAGFRAGLPVALPMALIGTSFGIYATDAGWPATTAIVMSLITFSGAAQVALIGVLAAGGSVGAAVAAGVLVSLRFLPVGLVIGPWIRGGAARRAIIGQALLDASLAVARVAPGRYSTARLLGSSTPQWLAWQLGTAVGAVAGPRLGDTDRLGVDALFPAFFLVLLLAEVRTAPAPARATAGCAAAIALALATVTPPGVPVIAASAAVLVGVLWR
jgi:branched chain amino acid efflux pump